MQLSASRKSLRCYAATRFTKLNKNSGFVDLSGNTRSVDPIKKRALSDVIRFLFGSGKSALLRDGDADYNVSNTDMLLDINEYRASEVRELISLIDYRNDFIHFNSSMRQQQTETNVNALQKLARIFLEKFSSGYCAKTGDLSFEKLLKLHKFRRLE